MPVLLPFVRHFSHICFAYNEALIALGLEESLVRICSYNVRPHDFERYGEKKGTPSTNKDGHSIDIFSWTYVILTVSCDFHLDHLGSGLRYERTK